MITDYFDKRAHMEFDIPDDYETDIEKDPFYLKFDENNKCWYIIYKNHPDFKNMPILDITTNKNKIIIETSVSPIKTDIAEIKINAHSNIFNIGSEWWIGSNTKTGEDISILRLFYSTIYQQVYFADIYVAADKNLFYITLFSNNSIDCVLKSSTHQSMFETKHFSLEIAL